MVSTREHLINVVNVDELKTQKQQGSAKRQRSEYRSFIVSCHGYQTLPAKRVNLTCHVIQLERGKPITSPARAGKPQGELLELWAEESGKSECHPVMGWIGIE